MICLFLFLDSTIDTKFFPDTIIDETNLEFLFSNYIRAGKYDEIKSLLEKEREKLLNTVYTFHVTFVKKYHDIDIEDKAILEESITSSTPGSGAQNSPSINVNQIFGAKVKVTYPSSNVTLYQDGDRMLDGMNILQLAAKYYPKGLEILSHFSRTYPGLFKLLKELLLERDNQIQNTPLHVASASSNIDALR